MESPTCLTDATAPLVADASIVINLNATGSAEPILTALPNRVLVVDAVRGELEDGGERGRRNAETLDALIAAGRIELVTLDETAEARFEGLVIGPAVDTLDDGEAVTIAYAVGRGAIAILDERKGMRICAERSPGLALGCTGDLLAHPDVLAALGKDALAGAVFNALYEGHMRVFPRHLDWVLDLIGPERAARCPSLHASVRQAAAAKKPSGG
jgi:predicted nucleic acid-binding protein